MNFVKSLFWVGMIAIVLFYIPLLFLPGKTMELLTEEDGFYESLTSVFFFFASIGFLYNFIKAKPRSIFFLLFALAFFFAAGEEISWGQRIFHFATPAAVAGMNAQGEFNFHNLAAIQHEHGLSASIKALLNFNRLFILFWAGYCIAIPLAVRYWGPIRNLILKLRIPVVSAWFGLLFLANEVICKALEILVVAHLPYDIPISEIKECLWGLFVFLMGLYFYSLVTSERSISAQEAV